MTLFQKLAHLESRLSSIQTKLGAFTTTLTFTVQSGAITIDPETGIEVPQATSVPIEVFLRQSKSQTRGLENLEVPGWVNASSILVEGYLITPSFLPATIRPMMVANLTVNDSSYPLSGKFLLLPSLQNDDTIPNHTIRGYAQFSPGGL